MKTAALSVLIVALAGSALAAEDEPLSADTSSQAADEAYDATKTNPIVDWIEKNIKGGSDKTMDEDYKDAGGTIKSDE